MNRRQFVLGSVALAAPVSAAPRQQSEAEYILCGDSLAYVMGPAFRESAKIHGVKAGVWAKGGSSARQWLVKKWFQKLARDFPNARTFIVSLGTNCTRVERPKLADDVSKIVNLVNDFRYEPEDDSRLWTAPHVVWLLPPPLAMETQYIHDAVAKSEVFSIDPGPLPLESDGIHPTRKGARLWVDYIARALWE